MASQNAAKFALRLLGPLVVSRDGREVALPRSRKARALVGVLALAKTPMSRSRLCDLLWDVPNDPRGELRWCLSKLRPIVDDAERTRLVSPAGQATVALDLSEDFVDTAIIDDLAKDGVEAAATERLRDAAALFRGELLDGMHVDGAPLNAWLLAERQHYRAIHVAIVSELTKRSEGDERLSHAEAWARLAPFDLDAHRAMIDGLVSSGRARDAETYVSSVIRAFEQEGLDWAPVREGWKAARAARAPAMTTSTIAPALASAVHLADKPPRHGSIVVMPFSEDAASSGGAASQVAHGLTDDIITRLAKLRVLFVIARGTSYALRERGIDAHEAGRILNVEYVVSGTVRRHGDRLSVRVELSETADAGILWTDELTGSLDETFSVLDSIVDRISSAIADEIERAEQKRAILKPPSSLDAWEAYHRGLWHMYRFTGPDNEIADQLFQSAVKLDPTFARAHAGLSFTHFQNVFLSLTPDRERQMELALEAAGRSLAADDRDPAAHWAMGRALWLRREAGAIAELERSVELSPNFALGHYTLGFVHAQSGDPSVAIDASDYSRQLSPFDPLQFGMLGSRALAHMRRGEREEAAEWAIKAASRPNAHAHILAIAASNLALANRRDQGRDLIARIRTKLPDYSLEDFLRAFRFGPDAETLLRQGAKQMGFD